MATQTWQLNIKSTRPVASPQGTPVAMRECHANTLEFDMNLSHCDSNCFKHEMIQEKKFLVSDRVPTSSATLPKKAAVNGRTGATRYTSSHDDWVALWSAHDIRWLTHKLQNSIFHHITINLTPAREDQKGIDVKGIVNQMSRIMDHHTIP